jgi:hypothetical protein
MQTAESNTEPGECKLFSAVQPVPEEQPGMPPEYDDTGGGGGQTSGTKQMGGTSQEVIRLKSGIFTLYVLGFLYNFQFSCLARN